VGVDERQRIADVAVLGHDLSISCLGIVDAMMERVNDFDTARFGI
jgi:hypothetical protein